jgi:hypothetical protein
MFGRVVERERFSGASARLRDRLQTPFEMA